MIRSIGPSVVVARAEFSTGQLCSPVPPIRSYLNGTTAPGVLERSIPYPFEVFVAGVTARLIDDTHLWVRTLLR